MGHAAVRAQRTCGRVEHDDVMAGTGERRCALERVVGAQREATEDRREVARAQARVGGDDEDGLTGGDERGDRAGYPAVTPVAVRAGDPLGRRAELVERAPDLLERGGEVVAG